MLIVLYQDLLNASNQKPIKNGATWAPLYTLIRQLGYLRRKYFE